MDYSYIAWKYDWVHSQGGLNKNSEIWPAKFGEDYITKIV